MIPLHVLIYCKGHGKAQKKMYSSHRLLYFISGLNNTIASRGLDLTLGPSRCDPSDNSNHTLRPKETDFQKCSVHITFATL